jgi:hypothetical protein
MRMSRVTGSCLERAYTPRPARACQSVLGGEREDRRVGVQAQAAAQRRVERAAAHLGLEVREPPGHPLAAEAGDGQRLGGGDPDAAGSGAEALDHRLAVEARGEQRVGGFAYELGSSHAGHSRGAAARTQAKPPD